jgi:hypothetical protein
VSVVEKKPKKRSFVRSGKDDQKANAIIERIRMVRATPLQKGEKFQIARKTVCWTSLGGYCSLPPLLGGE